MIYVGKVVDNADPLELGRVRAKVPGTFEPSTDWLIPLFFGGSEADRGGGTTPRVDGLVLIILAEGNLGKGYYLTPNRNAYSKDGETVLVWGNVSVAIIEDTDPSGGAVRIEDGANLIEIQKATGSVVVESPNVVRVEATSITLRAPDLTLNGRRVLPGSEPI